MSNSTFAAVPSPFRQLMEEINPTDIYVFSEEVGVTTSCVVLSSETPANELIKIQRSQAMARRSSRTLRGSDVRAFILTMAQAHGLIGRGVFVDLRHQRQAGDV